MKIELKATPISEAEQLEILAADLDVLPENLPLALSIIDALAKLDAAINSRNPDK